MFKAVFSIVAVGAAAGIALTPAAASAATSSHRAILAQSITRGPSPDPTTTVTFTVTTAFLTISSPVSVDLGAGAPGTTIGPTPVGLVTVTDDRAALDATWSATASSTDFTTGAGSPAETIPAGDVAYTVGAFSLVSGTVIPVGTDLPALSSTPTQVVAGTLAVGDNTVSWDPTLTVSVPASAVGGVYTGTLTESVTGGGI